MAGPNLLLKQDSHPEPQGFYTYMPLNLCVRGHFSPTKGAANSGRHCAYGGGYGRVFGILEMSA